MGTWQSTLYGNDTTCDVRDTYMGHLKEQLSNQEAYEKTFQEYEELIGEEDEEPLFWFALAETQWKVGRLTPKVKEKALKWIRNNGGVGLWEESTSGSTGWRKTLSKLEIKLESPMRTEKKIRKPEVLNQNMWNIGDVYAYQLHTEESKKHGTYGKYVLLQKMGESQRFLWMTPKELKKVPVYMSIYVFDRIFDYKPNLKDVESVRILPRKADIHEELVMTRLMEMLKKKDYPENYLSYLGNQSISFYHKVVPELLTVCWNEIEKGINSCINYYYDKEYEEVKKGIFKITDTL